MRALFISYGSIFNPFLPGGGALRIHKFSSFLTQRNWNVTLVTGNFTGSENIRTQYKTIFLGDGRNLYTSLLSFSLGVIHFARKKSKDYDVIIDDYSPFYSSLAPIYNKNSVIQFQIYIGKHNFRRFPYPINALFYLNEKLYPKLFRKAIFVCDFLVKAFGFDLVEKKYSIVWNGIEQKNLSFQASEENFILYCGRISEYMKGIDILFEAIKKIKDFLVRKNIYIAVVGDGPERSKFEKASQNFGLPVKFFGWISDYEKLSQFYSKCLFSVLPSRYEGFGLSILEAASFSKTSVISDIPAFSWAKHFCVSFRSENPDDLAEKIIYLVEKRDERKFLGDLGKSLAKQKTWDKVSQEFEKAILDMMD
ncbi:MAG: glycosyltransferase family 4 protein [bacterium]|nr:glycosyltransferase family 4 protein [bacterium]